MASSAVLMMTPPLLGKGAGGWLGKYLFQGFCLCCHVMSNGVEHWFERRGSQSAGQNGSWSSLVGSGEGKERPLEDEEAG